MIKYFQVNSQKRLPSQPWAAVVQVSSPPLVLESFAPSLFSFFGWPAQPKRTNLVSENNKMVLIGIWWKIEVSNDDTFRTSLLNMDRARSPLHKEINDTTVCHCLPLLSASLLSPALHSSWGYVHTQTVDGSLEQNTQRQGNTSGHISLGVTTAVLIMKECERRETVWSICQTLMERAKVAEMRCPRPLCPQ